MSIGQVTRGSFLAAALALVALVVPHAAGQAPPGFTLNSGFPVTAGIANKDGGMFVNLDDDPELEYVGSADGNPYSKLYALNPDGTFVPGWPVELGDGAFGAPAYGDIDGDGVEEIVAQTFYFGVWSDLYALRKDGTVVPGFPVAMGGAFRSPSLADVDHDGDLEILACAKSGANGEAYIFDGDGTLLPGWPQVFPDEIIAGGTPAVADVDGDGDLEIFVASFYRLYGLNPDGTYLPGFPWTPPDSTHAFNSYSSPSLADFDGDGDLEIVITTTIEQQQPGHNSAPQVHVLHHDATRLTGWPRRLPDPYIGPSGATGINTPVSVADIDGDGSLDIAVSDITLSPDPVNVLMAWDSGGSPLPGFPVGPLPGNQVQIMIADIDNDGYVELFTDSNWAANPNKVWNHDGTPVTGWELGFLSGSGQPDFADIDADGFMDFMLPVNNPVTGIETVEFHLFSSTTIPFNPDLAPVATYQYNYRRNGVVPQRIFAIGDVNCDEAVNGFDIDPFVMVVGGDLTGYYALYPDCDHMLGDINSDGAVDGFDIDPFVALIGGG